MYNLRRLYITDDLRVSNVFGDLNIRHYCFVGRATAFGACVIVEDQILDEDCGKGIMFLRRPADGAF